MLVPHDFNAYINKRLSRIMSSTNSILKLFAKMDMEVRKVTVPIDFYHINPRNDGSILVPTGSKDKPAGISKISDCFIIVTSEDAKDVGYVIHSEDLKSVIKENINDLTKEFDPSFVVAFVIPKDIMENDGRFISYA